MGIYNKIFLNDEDKNDSFLNEDDREVEDDIGADEYTPDIQKDPQPQTTSKLLELNSALRLYCANFRNLHWNSKGEEFDDAHVTIAQGYVDLCEKYIDSTGEMLTRLGMNPLNYIEIVEFLNNAEYNYMTVNSSKLYTRREIIENSQKMLEDMVALIVLCLNDPMIGETINAGIKSDLESMLNEFDIQARYINKRRMTE